MVGVGSWGRLGSWPHEVRALGARTLARLPPPAAGGGLAYGMGRSYGDVCLNPGGTLWTTRGLDKFIAFDAATGALTCEAGVLLRDIQQLFVGRGWMLPVTPGTQYVTLLAGGGPVCDSIDFNNDTSFFDPQDIDAFLSVYSEGPCIPETATCNDIDFNNDTSVFDPCDISSFLLQFSEGPCELCPV